MGYANPIANLAKISECKAIIHKNSKVESRLFHLRFGLIPGKCVIL